MENLVWNLSEFFNSRIEMLVVQLLLPRFLVVEVVFFIHFLQSSQACPSSKINPKRDAKNLKMTCQVPIGRNQIREEPLFYNIDGQYLLPNRQNGSNFITILFHVHLPNFLHLAMEKKMWWKYFVQKTTSSKLVKKKLRYMNSQISVVPNP